jgi:hypothetical protein
MVDVVEEFLSNYPEEIRRISSELRNMARRAMRGAHEFLYYDAINFSLSDSPLGRVCYISPMPTYVALGFLFGARLDDQHHLLQGIGKRARHVKIKTLEEARNPALKELIKAAWTHGTDPLPKKKRRTKRAHRSQRRSR